MPESEVSSKPKDTALYHMNVTRIYVDNPHIVLYQNKVGLVYRALKWHDKVYPHNIILHVYGSRDLSKIKMFDDWGTSYHHLKEEKLMGYTWQGKFIFNLGKHPPPSPLKTGDTLKPEDSDFNVSMPKYVRPLDATFGDMHMHPPEPRREGYFGGYEPRVDPTFPFPKVDPMFPRADPTFPFPRPEPTFPRTEPTFPFLERTLHIHFGNLRHHLQGMAGIKRVRKDHRKRDDQKVRPTSLQKFCKKFHGTGDPYDHVAQYHQLIFAAVFFFWEDPLENL